MKFFNKNKFCLSSGWSNFPLCGDNLESNVQGMPGGGLEVGGDGCPSYAWEGGSAGGSLKGWMPKVCPTWWAWRVRSVGEVDLPHSWLLKDSIISTLHECYAPLTVSVTFAATQITLITMTCLQLAS